MKTSAIKTSVAVVFLFIALSTLAQSTPGFTDLGIPPGINNLSFMSKNAIATDNGGNIWIGTQPVSAASPYPGILAKWNQGNWEVFTSLNSGLPADTVYSLFAFENRLYIGTSQGLAFYDGDWEVVTIDNGLANNHVRALMVDSQAIFAGTNGGLSVFSNNVWTTYDTLNSGICSNRVRALAMDDTGRLWIGTENGLSSFYEGTWTTYNSQNSGLTAPIVRTLLFDDDNNLWIGTQGEGGLFKKVAQEIQSFYDLFPLQAIATNTVASSAKDNSGNIYLAMRFGSQNLYQFVKIRNDHIIVYQSSFNASSAPLFVYKNDLLWFVNTTLPRNLYSFDMAQGNMYDAVNRIDINNISADFTSTGRIGWDISLHSVTHFEIPKGSGKNTIFTQIPWIGGIANGEALHFAGERFAQVGRDYWPGPVCNDAETYQQEQEKWNRVWKISNSEIDHHKINWNNPGYQVPEVIESWPAHGDTLKGQEWFIAPFMDLNGNGMYEPHTGEYPVIRGDQALFFVSNDHRGNHTESGGNVLGVEIRVMAYAFAQPSDSALYHTIFINYQIINRSETIYDSIYVGFFTDFDIGYSLDDYIGCDTLQNSYFAYNAIPTDNVYGTFPPSQGVTFLNNPLSTFIYFNNTTAGVQPWQTDPTVATEYYNYMKAIWKDGTPMVFGGQGHPGAGGGTERAHQIFPGDLNNPVDWHEVSLNNPPNDRRGLGSTCFGTFEPDQRICFDKAFVFGCDYMGNHISSVTAMKERIHQIRDFYANNIIDDCSDLLVTNVYEVKAPICNWLKCFPNPVSQILMLEYSPQTVHASYRLFNAMGALIKTAPLNTAITRIDVQHLNPGLHVLIVEDGRMHKHQKIIVQ